MSIISNSIPYISPYTLPKYGSQVWCDPTPTNILPPIFPFWGHHLDKPQFEDPWHTLRTFSYGEVSLGTRAQWKNVSCPCTIHPWVVHSWVLVHFGSFLVQCIDLCMVSIWIAQFRLQILSPIMKIQKQWVKILKSIVVEINFVLIVVARKWVGWQQFHWQFHPTTCLVCLNLANALPPIIHAKCSGFECWCFNY